MIVNGDYTSELSSFTNGDWMMIDILTVVLFLAGLG